MAEWLATCSIKTVAMEATGVYWIPVFEILEARGFEVLLVNARHVKNVPGRKSDVSDAEWLQELHSALRANMAETPYPRLIRVQGGEMRPLGSSPR